MTGPGSLDRARRLLAALDARGSRTRSTVARWRLMTEADLALRAGDVSRRHRQPRARPRARPDARRGAHAARRSAPGAGRGEAVRSRWRMHRIRRSRGWSSGCRPHRPRDTRARRTGAGRSTRSLEQSRRRGAMRHEREEALLALHADRRRGACARTRAPELRAPEGHGGPAPAGRSGARRRRPGGAGCGARLARRRRDSRIASWRRSLRRGRDMNGIRRGFAAGLLWHRRRHGDGPRGQHELTSS